MIDWFYIVVSAVFGLQLLLGCGTFLQSCVLIGIVAVVRYIIVPADCDIVLKLAELIGRPVESLKGRVVWVTGASSGIGAALAIRLAKAGVKVALSARSVDKLNRVKQRCIETGGVKERDILVLPLDVCDYSKHQPAFETVIEHFGELHVLVNNAGVSQRAHWEMIETEVDLEMFEVNVFSVMSLSRIATKYFLQKKKCEGGHLVVTSSTAGVASPPMSATYNGTKHALHGFFNTLRLEKAGLGLNVSIVCPGPVDSNLLSVARTATKGKLVGEERGGKKLSAERCAELYALTIANKLSESWIADNPVLVLMYAAQYLPVLVANLGGLLPVKAMQKLRDGRTVVQTSEDKKK